MPQDTLKTNPPQDGDTRRAEPVSEPSYVQGKCVDPNQQGYKTGHQDTPLPDSNPYYDAQTGVAVNLSAQARMRMEAHLGAPWDRTKHQALLAQLLDDNAAQWKPKSVITGESGNLAFDLENPEGRAALRLVQAYQAELQARLARSARTPT